MYNLLSQVRHSRIWAISNYLFSSPNHFHSQCCWCWCWSIVYGTMWFLFRFHFMKIPTKKKEISKSPKKHFTDFRISTMCCCSCYFGTDNMETKWNLLAKVFSYWNGKSLEWNLSPLNLKLIFRILLFHTDWLFKSIFYTILGKTLDKSSLNKAYCCSQSLSLLMA